MRRRCWRCNEVGTGGIGGAIGGGAVVTGVTGGAGALVNSGVLGGIGTGVGILQSGPEPCGVVVGDVVPCGDIYECGIVPSGGEVITQPCGPGVIGKTVVGTGGIGGAIGGGAVVTGVTGGAGALVNSGVLGGIGTGVGFVPSGPEPCGVVVGDVTKQGVPCGDIYECGIVPSGGEVITQPCGPGVIGKTVVGTGGIGGAIGGGAVVTGVTGGAGALVNSGVLGGIGTGVGFVPSGPEPCGVVVGDVTKQGVPCGDIYECGIVPSGGEVITQPCGPGVIGKTVVGTGGIGGAIGGGAVVTGVTGGAGALVNSGVLGGIGTGVGFVPSGPEPCGVVVGDVTKQGVPCGDIYECGIVPSGGEVITQPCGPGVIGKTVVGTGGIGGAIGGGAVVTGVTGGAGALVNSGVLGGIGTGVGFVPSGPEPCGVVVGDVTKQGVPCGDIYECGIVPSGGEVITQPCGPGVIGKTVVGTGGIGGAIGGGAVVTGVTGGAGALVNSGVLGGIGTGVGFVPSGPEPCGVVVGDVTKQGVPCGDIYECGIVPSGGEVITQPCGPGVIGKTVVGTGGIGGAIGGGAVVTGVTGGAGALVNSGVLGGIGTGVGFVPSGPEPCGVVVGDVTKQGVPCGDIYECGIVPSGGEVITQPCGPGVIGKTVVGTGGIGGAIGGGAVVTGVTGGAGALVNSGVLGGIGTGVGFVPSGPEPCGVVVGDVTKQGVPCGDIYECGIVPSGGEVITQPCGPGVIGKTVVGTGGIGGAIGGGAVVTGVTGGAGALVNSGVLGGIGTGVGFVPSGPEPCGVVVGDVTKQGVPCGDIYECGIVPSGGEVITQPCGPGVIGKTVVGTGGIGGAIGGGAVVTGVTGGAGALVNSGVLGGIGTGVGFVPSGPEPCGVVVGDVTKQGVPCGDIYECGIVPSGGEVITQPCGPGVIGKTVVGTGGIGGAIGGGAVVTGVTGGAGALVNSGVLGGIGTGVGFVPSGPEPCGVVVGDVTKQGVPCGDIYECGIVPSGGEVITQPCGPGVIGKTVVGTGGIGGAIGGGAVVTGVTGGAGALVNSGVLGGIGTGVGFVPSGPEPCGVVVGDVTKQGVPCGDIYECGIVPSGGEVITQPCGPGVIGKTVVGTGGIGGAIGGGAVVTGVTGGAGALVNSGVLGGIGTGVGFSHADQ